MKKFVIAALCGSVAGALVATQLADHGPDAMPGMNHGNMHNMHDMQKMHDMHKQ